MSFSNSNFFYATSSWINVLFKSDILLISKYKSFMSKSLNNEIIFPRTNLSKITN